MLNEKKGLLRCIPQVDELLRDEAVNSLSASYPKPLLREVIRELTNEIRQEILALEEDESLISQGEAILQAGLENMRKQVLLRMEEKEQRIGEIKRRVQLEEQAVEEANQHTEQEEQSAGEASQYTEQEGQSTGEAGQHTGQEGQSTGEANQHTEQEGQSAGEAGRHTGKEEQSTGEASQHTEQEEQSTGEASRHTGQEEQGAGEAGRCMELEEQYTGETDWRMELEELNIEEAYRRSLRRVINATGVILHANLGRARLKAGMAARAAAVAEGYSNLEYDLEKGTRGSRHAHAEEIICQITGAEAAIIINNNAAAVMLCLSALAKDGEVLVSRGELVEISGSFRIPEMIEQSGCLIKEVGTTNKTRRADYEQAFEPERTKAILKVHTSNYNMIGYTEAAALAELKDVARQCGLPLIYDLGSGLMVDLQAYGVNEPTVKEGLRDGADLVLFSGDKLLGGPQAGIAVGKKKYIDQMKKHPLARVVRIDKMTLAALEETFRCYVEEEKALREIPALAMIASSVNRLHIKAEKLAESMANIAPDWELEVVSERSQLGGGSAPLAELPTFAVSAAAPGLSADELEEQFRRQRTPIIVKIAKNKVMIDVRTVKIDEFDAILAAVENIKQTAEGIFSR